MFATTFSARREFGIAAVAALILATNAAAQTWTGAVSGSWNVAGNWSPVGVPANNASTQLIFDATANGVMTNDIPATLSIFNLNQMTFTANAPAYSLTGDTLSFHFSGGNSAAIVMNSANAVSIAENVTLNNNLTVSGTGSGVMTLSGTVSGFTTGLVDTGAGTLAVTGANTYTGATSVSAGATLAIPTIANGGVSSPLGASSSAVSNLTLGTSANRGNLLLTGLNAAYSTDRGVSVLGNFASGSGGAIGVQNAGTTLNWNGQILGPGTLIKSGAGTLTLTNTANSYAGGAVVEGGTLAAGASGAVFPVGSAVTVQSGATFDLGPYSNASAPVNALGSLTLNGGTLRATGATNSDFFVSQINMTGGTIDFNNTPFTWIHLTNANGLTINASPAPSTWIGGGTSRVQNDTAGALTINAAAGATLNAGIILSNGGTNPNFTITGAGSVRLSNTGNTANITASSGTLHSNDLSTNVGSSAYGTLGTGNFALTNASFLLYDGPTATTAKPMSITNSSIGVLTPGANLTLSSAISESAPGSFFQVLGPAYPNNLFATSTVTVLGDNNYSGPTYVGYQGVLAIPTIANGGAASPIGTSSSDPANLVLGYAISFGGRGDLMLTGTAATYSTDRGATVRGFYNLGDGGGAIGVQNVATMLTWNGPITGPGEFIKSGAGTLVLTNTANNFQGGTVVEAGRLLISGANGAGILPAGSAVAIANGAQLNYTAFIDVTQTGSALDTIFNEGGTFRLSGNAIRLFLNQYWCYTGSTTDLTMPGTTPLRLDFTGAGAAINILGNSTWTGPGSYMLNNTTGEVPITIPPSATLTSNIDLASNLNFNTFNYYPYRLSGGGTLYLTGVGQNGSAITVSQGRLRVDSFTPIQDMNVILDGGTFQFSGTTTSSNQSLFLGPNGGTVEVSNAASTLTLTGYMNGFSGGDPGPFTKAGPGVLVLASTFSNTFLSGITVNAGRLEVGDDVQLGLANGITVNQLGTLRYTGNTTSSRIFTLNGGTLEALSGATLTLNGAAVGGGFLRGAGTFNLTGGTLISGSTTFNSTTINQTGPASLTNFTNGGTFINGAGTTLNWNGGLNQSTGTLTVSGTANVNDFGNNGGLNVPAGGLINNSGSSLVLGGGSTTFVGSVANLGGKIDLGGQQLIVRGGLLVTNAGSFGSGNGVRNGTTVADYGALVKGTGPYQAVITQNGGQYLPGNSPGTSQVGDFFINGGGNLIFEITDAGPSASFPSAPGVAGANPGWGLTQVFTSMNFTATPSNKFNIDMRTQLAPPAAPNSPGQMSSFDPSRAYSWLIFDLQPGAVFNGTFNPNAINFITTQFANPTTGGQFSLSRTGGQVFLTFTPVPEPATILAAAFVGLFGWWSLRRRRRPETRAV